MSESFLQLAPVERAKIILACSARLGRAPRVLEKDVWICWTLQHDIEPSEKQQRRIKVRIHHIHERTSNTKRTMFVRLP